jgi:hypothetical protein
MSIGAGQTARLPGYLEPGDTTTVGRTIEGILSAGWAVENPGLQSD